MPMGTVPLYAVGCVGSWQWAVVCVMDRLVGALNPDKQQHKHEIMENPDKQQHKHEIVEIILH
jgi:hypothetical protein